MTRNIPTTTPTPILWGTAGVAAATVIAAFAVTVTPRSTQAFPAYAQKTGLHCAMCHVNPKGGGPLNPYGIKWVTGGMKAHPAPPPKPKK